MEDMIKFTKYGRRQITLHYFYVLKCSQAGNGLICYNDWAPIQIFYPRW